MRHCISSVTLMPNGLLNESSPALSLGFTWAIVPAGESRSDVVESYSPTLKRNFLSAARLLRTRSLMLLARSP